MKLEPGKLYRDYLFTTAFFLVLFSVAILRFENLDDQGITQDESTILEFTAGLLERGYPYLVSGETEVHIATYELVPFFIAPFIKLLGWSEYSVRLPAWLFSLGTLTLIYFVGKSWFDSRIAFWAVLLCAISPWSNYWSANCFYPSQVQFFTLLTVFFLSRMLREEKIQRRNYYFVALSICFTFLSWEGIGLILPAFALIALWLAWWRWDLVYSIHAWASLFIVLVVVAAQLLRRGFLQESYLNIGASRAEISSPQIALLQPSFDPYYYIQNIFLIEQHIVLTVFFMLGIFFFKKNWNMRFAFGFVFITALFFIQLLPVWALRYLYYILPVFLLTASASTFLCFDAIYRRVNANSSGGVSARAMLFSGMLIILAMQAAILSNQAINMKLTEQQVPGGWELDPARAGIDVRDVIETLKVEYRPGDIIVAVRGTFALHLYTGLRSDYTLQEIASSVVAYEPLRNMPFYSDKWIGAPVLKNKQQLEELFHHHDRVWFFSAPAGSVASALSSELYQFIKRTMLVKAEGFHTSLYLLDRNSGYN